MTAAAAKHAEIARRYKAKDQPFNFAALRVAELHRLFGARYSGGKLYELPDDDAGRDDLTVLLHHLAHTHGDIRRLQNAIKARAPWLKPEEVHKKIRSVLARPMKWRAPTLGKRLRLTEAERRRLDIRTIGAINMTPQQRQEARRLRQRTREQQRRRRAGAKPQATSASRLKPWQTEGVSRRTWYRRRGTTSCAI